MEFDKTSITVLLLVVLGIAVGMPIINQYAVQGQQIQSQTEQDSFTSFNQTQNLLQQRVVPGTFAITYAACVAGVNCTGDQNTTLREGFEYTVSYQNGYVRMINKTGTFNESYNWMPSGYIGGSGSLIVSIVAILFAVVILVLIIRAIFSDED